MSYSQTMTFADLRNEVRLLRFNSNQDNSINRWINAAYARIWNADEWTFKYAQSTFTVTAGSTQASNQPNDFGVAIGVFRDDGYPLLYLPPRGYFDLYLSLTDDTGAPQHYTIINEQIIVGPKSNVTSNNYTLIYERRLTDLGLDSDVPAIPPQHHYLIVEGALSMGLRLYNDFTWEFMEQGFLAGVQDMRKEWLNDQRGEVTVWGRDEIEALPTAWGV